MKTYQTLILAASLTGLLPTTTARSADTPDNKPPSELPRLGEPKPGDTKPDQPATKPADAPTPKVVSEADKELRLNFRDVPLDMVLNYLSDAAGFTIVLETKVEGRVTVWSNQPLTKEEAVNLLNSILNKN